MRLEIEWLDLYGTPCNARVSTIQAVTFHSKPTKNQMKLKKNIDSTCVRWTGILQGFGIYFVGNPSK